MRTFDFTPLWRSTVGFDRLFNLLDESTRWTGEESNYPPYNIERTGEDHYWISLALAGFKPDEVNDGTANTIMLGEVSDGFGPWGRPRNVRDPAAGVRRGADTFGGPASRGGTYFGMADGSVRLIDDNVDPNVLWELSTPNGGE